MTVIIAAFNEEEAVEATLERIAASTYAGPLTVVLADNNSTDRTAELARGGRGAPRARLSPQLRARRGQAPCAQHGARDVTTPIVVTVDADTFLQPRRSPT